MASYSDPARLAGRKKYYSRTYDPDTGQRNWVSTGCSDMKTAKQWVATRRMETAMGKDRVRAAKTAEVTVAHAADVWLTEKQEKTSLGRYRIYKYQAAYWKKFFGAKRLDDVTPDDVRLFLRKRRSGVLRLDAESRAKKLAAATINEERNAIANFFGFCVRNDWLQRSPVLGVERYKGEVRQRVRALTEEEEARLLRACAEPVEITVKARRNLGGRKGGAVSTGKTTFTQTYEPPTYLKPIVLVALRSGLRRGSILQLRWRDCDLERGVWSIPGDIVKTGEPYTQPIAASVVQALKDYRAAVLVTEKLKDIAPDAPVFPLGRASSFKRAFQSAAKRAGIDGLTFHDLRRCFLNRLRERGVPIDAAMALTGHRSIQVVMRHYREVPETATRAAVAALDGKATEKGAADGAKTEA